MAPPQREGQLLKLSQWAPKNTHTHAPQKIKLNLCGCSNNLCLQKENDNNNNSLHSKTSKNSWGGFFFFSNLLTDDPEPDEVAGDRSGADLALVHPGVLQADRADPEEPSGGGAPLSRPVAGRASLLLLLLLLPRAPRASLREDRPGVEPPVGGVGVQAGADDVQVVPADPGNLRSSRK